MSATSAAGKRKEQKEQAAKVRQMFELEVTHIRMGDWRGTKGSEVIFIGTTSQLHGTVCTDCPSSPNYDPNYRKEGAA